MTTRLLPLAALLVLAGCGASGADTGGAIPVPAPPPSQATLDSMPPEARRESEQAKAAGASMAQQMNARMKGSGH